MHAQRTSAASNGSAILNHWMPNGASVADWLGTAATAARVAAMHLDAVRNGKSPASDAELALACVHLELARAEVVAVRAEVRR